MAVNGSEVVRQLSQIELMGHLFRRAGFGATRDALEVALANGYEATLEELLAHLLPPSSPSPTRGEGI